MDWEGVRKLPPEKLPPLTPEQSAVARQLHVPEADYARAALVNQRAGRTLLDKTSRFARLLAEEVGKKDREAVVEKVTLDTSDQRFEVELLVRAVRRRLWIAEELVDDLFERGLPDAEQRLARVLDVNLRTMEDSLRFADER
jgi:hypothetical protein